MKVVLLAFMSSITVHVVYIAGMVLVGYIKTRNYKPDFASAWDEVEALENKVVFVKVNSPFLSLFTFLGVAVICGIIIFSYRKLLN